MTRPGSPPPTSRTAHLVFAACLAAGAALRFTGLTRESLWLDEGWALNIIDRASLGDVIRTASGEVHPPFYYILAWIWSQVFGLSDVALRSFSALLGAAAVPAAWTLARRLVAPRAALVAMAIVALSPLLIKQAHDIKQYSLVLLLATISTERFLAFAQGASNKPLIGWTIATTLLAYTHFIGLTAVLAQAVLLGFGVPRAERRARDLLAPWLVGHGVVVLAVAPWVPYLVAAMGRFQGFPGTQTPHALWRALVGIAGTARGVAMLFGLAALGLLLRWRRGRRLPPGFRAALTLGAIPIIVPWVVSALTHPSFVTRITIHAVPPLAAALGAGLVGLLRRPRRALAIAMAVSLVALGLVRLRPRIEREQWREAAALVASESRPGDRVLALGVPDGRLLRHYLPQGGPAVLDATSGIPSASPDGGRLYLVPSTHTKRFDAWRERLLRQGWREGESTQFKLVRVVRFGP